MVAGSTKAVVVELAEDTHAHIAALGAKRNAGLGRCSCCAAAAAAGIPKLKGRSYVDKPINKRA